RRRRRPAARRGVLLEPPSARLVAAAPGAGPLAGAPALFARLRRGRGALDDRRVEIDARLPREFGAELVAQHPGAHLRDLALGQIAEFERAEGDADEPVDRQPQMLKHLLDLAVLALAQA